MSLLSGKQIYLTGFMATGKSKVGPLLADRLQRLYVDTDDLIVEADGRSIPEIFEQDGEAAFRQIEHDCVTKASAMSEAVVSLGGGAVTQEGNWEVIRQTGVCLCFTASQEVIYARVSRSDERPLLSGLDEDALREKIRRMLSDREPYYSRADAYVESVEERTPDETTELAIEELRKLDTA